VPTEEERELELEIAEKAFLAASTAVWREIERIEASGEGYHGIAASTRLRRKEREAWERYRDALEAAGRT
jgi:hypothetical protein